MAAKKIKPADLLSVALLTRRSPLFPADCRQMFKYVNEPFQGFFT